MFLFLFFLFSSKACLTNTQADHTQAPQSYYVSSWTRRSNVVAYTYFTISNKLFHQFVSVHIRFMSVSYPVNPLLVWRCPVKSVSSGGKF